MRKLSPPSPAILIATLALFLAAGGGAWAAAGTRSSSRATAHQAAGSSRGPRGPRGFRGPRGPQGPKGPAGPSDGFVIKVAASQPLTGGNDNTIAQLNVPSGGSYIVTASVELGNQGTSENPLSCTLLQNFNPLSSGSADLPGESIFAATIALTGAATSDGGGSLRLTCNPSSGASARNAVITAIKVGSLHVQTSTP